MRETDKETQGSRPMSGGQKSKNGAPIITKKSCGGMSAGFEGELELARREGRRVGRRQRAARTVRVSCEPWTATTLLVDIGHARGETSLVDGLSRAGIHSILGGFGGVTSAELTGLGGGSGCTRVVQVWFCCDA